jgi:hypothetical protein
LEYRFRAKATWIKFRNSSLSSISPWMNEWMSEWMNEWMRMSDIGNKIVDHHEKSATF